MFVKELNMARLIKLRSNFFASWLRFCGFLESSEDNKTNICRNNFSTRLRNNSEQVLHQQVILIAYNGRVDDYGDFIFQ